MRHAASVLLAIYLLGCGKDMGSEVPLLSLPAVVDLRVGQSVRVGDASVAIAFHGVSEDSRCPIGAMCFWEGDGAARITIQPPLSSAVECTLHTTLDPKVIAASGITVRLKNLSPYPKIDLWIDRFEYVVTLEIEASPVLSRVANSPAQCVLPVYPWHSRTDG
jgi:hypothetical protein